ncbi:F-box/LRR-repeat protein 2 [Eurytemora carolleeae]|uniref:F-box/LRR-repeat protein 2 n=1 Tax=Eurytemora carolleeae TaxID=1294199 RepID=UPI000C78C35E|nr:F-box/LRR-repeat protein 2 [Eurytemora carolleeae]|eukprot:XP_023325692.1 F-box/LRR-repeat protein 2-like [Eurytemora affinis]
MLIVLNAAGCPGITDSTLKMLSKSQGCLEVLNVSGCSRITDIGLLSLYSIQDYLKSADFSGCPRLSGVVLKAFINSCSSLQPDKLYYCDLIQVQFQNNKKSRKKIGFIFIIKFANKCFKQFWK